MKCLVLAAAVVLFVQTQAHSAVACGQTGEIVQALLPLADAADVPINAALIGASNARGSTLWLRKVQAALARDTGAQAGDAGDVEQPLATECKPTSDGSLCIARQTDLEPETTYEWQVRIVSPEGTGTEYVPPASEWRRFTTSRATHSEVIPSVSVEVTRNEVHPPLCGGEHNTTLEFSAAALQSPLVVNIAGFTPSYVMMPVTLAPGLPSVEFNLYSAPTCITPEVIDVTGASTTLDEVCIADILPPTYYDESGAVVDAPAPTATDAQPTEPQPSVQTPSGGPSAPGEQTPSTQPTDESKHGSGVGLSAVDSDANADNGCTFAPATARQSVWQWLSLALVAVGAVLRRAQG